MFGVLFLVVSSVCFTHLRSSEVKTNADPPIGIKQEVSAKCQTMLDCPAYISEKQWHRYQISCCPKHLNQKFHCIEHRDRQNHLHVVKACVDPVTCEAGHYPFIKEAKADGVSYASVECRPCEDGYFEPYRTCSYKFRFATCRRQWQSCPKEHGRIQVRQGDTRSDTLCRCLWEESYIPSRRMSECLSLDGFSDEANCHCVHKKCPAGQRVNKEYVCAPEPVISTEATSTQASEAKTTRKPSTRSSTTRTAGTPLALIIFTALFFGLVLPLLCQYMHL